MSKCFIVSASLLLLFGCVVRSQESTESPYTLSDFSGIKNPTKENKLPDLSKSGVQKQLTCSVCRAVAGDIRELFMERLDKKETPKNGKKKRLSDLDIAEVTDGFCERLAKEYSMMTLDNQPDFKEGERTWDKGYWVSQFFELRCSEILEKKEEEMLKHFTEYPDQFLSRICNDCVWKQKDLAEAANRKHEEAAKRAKEEAEVRAKFDGPNGGADL